MGNKSPQSSGNVTNVSWMSSNGSINGFKIALLMKIFKLALPSFDAFHKSTKLIVPKVLN